MANEVNRIGDNHWRATEMQQCRFAMLLEYLAHRCYVLLLLFDESLVVDIKSRCEAG